MDSARLEPGPACSRGEPVTFRFDGRAVAAFEGETLGAALHAAGERVLMRSIKYHRPRGLFCNVGKCANCLVRVDGTPNVRACVTPVRDGMVVETQNAFPSARRDFLGVFDRVYRRNLDMHTRFTRPAPVAWVFNRVVRRMAGLGRIPDLRPLRKPAIAREEVDVLVVGAGPSGLAAAAAAAEGAASVLLVEEADRVGATLLFEPDGVARADDLARRVTDAGGRILTRTVAFGCYLTDGKGNGLPAPGVVAVMTPERVVQVKARALVVATGYHETPPMLPGNDLPGVMGARAALVLLHRHGVLPGREAAFVGEGPLAARAREDLAKAGARVVEGAPTEVFGGRGVEGVVVDDRKASADLVVCSGDETPRVELLQQCGARLAPAGNALAPVTDGAATSVRGVFAAGSVAGARGLDERLAAGARAGEAAAAHARSVGK